MISVDYRIESKYHKFCIMWEREMLSPYVVMWGEHLHGKIRLYCGCCQNDVTCVNDKKYRIRVVWENSIEIWDGNTIMDHAINKIGIIKSKMSWEDNNISVIHCRTCDDVLAQYDTLWNVVEINPGKHRLNIGVCK